MPALLLSMLTHLFLSSSLSLSYFRLAVPMRKCLGKHSCMSFSFPIVILNDTSFFSDSATTKCTKGNSVRDGDTSPSTSNALPTKLNYSFAHSARLRLVFRSQHEVEFSLSLTARGWGLSFAHSTRLSLVFCSQHRLKFVFRSQHEVEICLSLTARGWNLSFAHSTRLKFVFRSQHEVEFSLLLAARAWGYSFSSILCLV